MVMPDAVFRHKLQDCRVFRVLEKERAAAEVHKIIDARVTLIGFVRHLAVVRLVVLAELPSSASTVVAAIRYNLHEVRVVCE
jgi:hypothetical protein